MQVLLKLVWLYSEQPDTPLKGVVAQELAMFEAGMKLEAIRRQQIEAAKKERPWPALDQWISKKIKGKTKWTSAMLLAVLPLSYDGDSIYRDGEKLHRFTGSGKPILQLVTFCNRLYVGVSTVQFFYAQHCTVKCTTALRATAFSHELFF